MRVTEALIERAAELRAAGRSWEDVGLAVRRAGGRVRKWPREHAGLWAIAYKRAQKEVLDSAGNESLSALRGQLRVQEDEKIKQAAAVTLLKHRTTQAKSSGGRKRTFQASVTAI